MSPIHRVRLFHSNNIIHMQTAKLILSMSYKKSKTAQYSVGGYVRFLACLLTFWRPSCSVLEGSVFIGSIIHIIQPPAARLSVGTFIFTIFLQGCSEVRFDYLKWIRIQYVTTFCFQARTSLAIF